MTSFTGRRQRHGFSLIELLVAVALGVLILLALTILFARNTGNQSELERGLRQLENARFSFDMINEDLMHAGYFSDFSPDSLATAPSYQNPDPCATLPGSMGWDTSVSPIQIPFPIQGIAADTAVACLKNRKAGTEAFTVRHADTGPTIAVTAGDAKNLYIQVARCGSDNPRVIAAAVPAANPFDTFKLLQPDCVTSNNAIRRLLQRTYYIADCNDCSAGDGIPTLKRVEMVDGELRTLAVAEGVENMQLEYGLDTNGNSIADVFATLGSGKLTGVAPYTWNNVLTARIHLLTRTTQTTAGHTDLRSYKVGPDVMVKTPSDGYKRILMTSTVRLVNVGGRRE